MSYVEGRSGPILILTDAGMHASLIARENNALLRALTAEECRQWLADASMVSLERGEEIGAPVPTSVFFPSSVVCSVVTPTDGTVVETAVIGNEGVTPPCFANHVDRAMERVVVLVSGEALRVDVPAFQQAVNGSARLRRMLGIFSQSLLSQAMQISGCSRRHPVSRQTARWLLAARDRTFTNDMPVTHATLAQMLGVRRSSVTLAADALRSAGAIDYTRGQIRIVDSHRLRSAACDCYDAIRKCREDVFRA